MKSFVIFKVLDQLFGIDIECVKRILPSQYLTDMPDEEDHIEGMFQYEDTILKVLSFRRLIRERSYEEDLLVMFPELKAEHKAWLDALQHSVDTGEKFSKTTNPHSCHLGKWIDSFHPEDKEVAEVMKNLDFHHQRFHRSAVDVLDYRDDDPEMAKQWITDNVYDIYDNTLKHLTQISQMTDRVSANLQSCLILIGADGKSFGMNIDKVEDIVHVEENDLHFVKEVQTMGEHMEVSAILEHNNKLITIVTNIRINKRGE